MRNSELILLIILSLCVSYLGSVGLRLTTTRLMLSDVAIYDGTRSPRRYLFTLDLKTPIRIGRYQILYPEDSDPDQRSNCGVDTTDAIDIFEGVADIEVYPWLGLLFYPVGIDDNVVTTTIVLITRQMALATALDIDKYPKTDFREMARVVLGRNCSVGPYIKVTEYTYHPDFDKTTYSSLAILQLDTNFVTQVIRPICPPPARLKQPEVYAMALTQDCTSAMVRVYKMQYVDPDDCQEFYRRSNLDITSLWPKHSVCARAVHDEHCVWRGGTILVSRINYKWRLLGVGTYGPGCGSPARFLDYGMYYPWVRRSLSKIGRPAVTRIASNHIILRRTMHNIQRFGLCEPEEIKTEIFTDTTDIKADPVMAYSASRFYYNLTLITNVDYSCVVIRALEPDMYMKPPILKLRRVCTNPFPVCYDFSTLQMDYVIDITFRKGLSFKINVYGREIRLIDIRIHRQYINKLFYGSGLPEFAVSNYDQNHTYSHSKFVTPKYNLSSMKFEQDPQYHFKNVILQTKTPPQQNNTH